MSQKYSKKNGRINESLLNVVGTDEKHFGCLNKSSIRKYRQTQANGQWLGSIV